MIWTHFWQNSTFFKKSAFWPFLVDLCNFSVFMWKCGFVLKIWPNRVWERKKWFEKVLSHYYHVFLSCLGRKIEIDDKKFHISLGRQNFDFSSRSPPFFLHSPKNFPSSQQLRFWLTNEIFHVYLSTEQSWLVVNCASKPYWEETFKVRSDIGFNAVRNLLLCLKALLCSP